MSYKVLSSQREEKKEERGPHPSWSSNYKNWRKLWEKSTDFSKKIMRNQIKVVEFFILGGKEVKNFIYIQEFITWEGKKIPPSVNVEDFLDENLTAIALCAQLSWKTVKENHCINLNFQQDFQNFANETRYYLKIDPDRELWG